jgi:hypothetical protein
MGKGQKSKARRALKRAWREQCTEREQSRQTHDRSVPQGTNRQPVTYWRSVGEEGKPKLHLYRDAADRPCDVRGWQVDHNGDPLVVCKRQVPEWTGPRRTREGAPSLKQWARMAAKAA